MLILKYRIWTLISHCKQWLKRHLHPPDCTELRHRPGCIYSNRCRIPTSPLSGLCDFSFFHLQFPAQLCSVSRCWWFHHGCELEQKSFLVGQNQLWGGFTTSATQSISGRRSIVSILVLFLMFPQDVNISLRIFVYSPALIILHNAEFRWFILHVLNAPDLSDATLQEELFACLFLLHAQP